MIESSGDRSGGPDSDQSEMIEFLKRSLEDVDAGRTSPAIEALDRLAERHGLKSTTS